jgi:signal transduction histidine kinase
MVLLHDEDTGILTVEVADAAGGADALGGLVGATIAVEDTQFAAAVHARAHVVVEHLDKAAPWPGPAATGGATVVPLVTSEALHGLLIVTEEAGARPSQEDLTALTAFAGQAALALERSQAQQDREMFAIVEDRERIARDLHDVVIQRLFATGLRLQTAARLARVPELAERVNGAVDELDTTIRDIRSAIFELRSPMSAELRIEVRTLVEAAATSLGFRPTLELTGPVDSATDADVRADVLAVLREALSNVVRHAGASAVTVAIHAGGGRLTVRVSDDGVGIAEDVARSGLSNMRDRALRHGGTFEVSPARPSGTIVEWSVPL